MNRMHFNILQFPSDENLALSKTPIGAYKVAADSVTTKKGGTMAMSMTGSVGGAEVLAPARGDLPKFVVPVTVALRRAGR